MSVHVPSSPRRIAVVVPKYGLAGGAEQFASALTERLARSTPHEFHVFAHQWREVPGSPVHFHRLRQWRWPRCIRPWAFAVVAERALRKNHFDLVHSHDRIFRADVFSLHCTPHRFWVRDIRAKAPSLFDRAMIAMERRMISENPAATFLPVSSLSADLFRCEYPQIKGRWDIMPPGVDYERFAGVDRGSYRDNIRTRYGIAADAFVVLFVGMNFEHKGLDAVMASAAEAKKQLSGGRRLHLLVVGKGNVAKYSALAARLGLASSVTFTGAITSGLDQYYRAADCLMLLSAFETFGMVVLEAMAAGLPVIISRNVGARDLVRTGVSGFVANCGDDVNALAGHILSLSCPVENQLLGSVGASIAAEHDWTKTAAKMAEFYQVHFDERRR